MIKWQNPKLQRQARDRLVVAYRICGLCAASIADAMRLSTSTVYSVLHAYGINNRLQGYYELYRFSRQQLALPDWLPDRGMPNNGIAVEKGALIEAELIEQEMA